MKAIIVFAALATGACVPAASQEPEGPTSAADASGMCDASRAQSLIGRSASDALLEEAKRLSGAKVARFLRPGEVVTLEYSAERINLRLDEKDLVTAVDCG